MTPRERPGAARLLSEGPAPTAAVSTTASSSRCGACWSARSSCTASKPIRPRAPPPATARRRHTRRVIGTVYRISDFELASRLSFFLWSSIPDDELLDAAAQGTLRNRRRARAPGAADAGRPALARPWPTTSAASGCCSETWRPTRPGETYALDFDETLRQSMRRETELLLRQHRAREPRRARTAHGRLHVPERAAGAALRHSRTFRAATSAAWRCRPTARGAACSARAAS